MIKYLILLSALALCLSGCGDTTVYLPEEEVVELRGADVVHIPVNPDEAAGETEEPYEETTASMEPGETELPETNKATVAKKAATSAKKTTSGSTEASNKGTITAAGTKKPATEKPSETEPSVTEPPETEPPETEPPHYDIWDYEIGNLEYAMAAQINAHRTAAELPELAFDEWLCAIASQRSFELSSLWSHTRPDGRGFATVLDDYGYGAGTVQELLVYDSGAGDGAAMADRWLESDAHRESLLGDYHTVGIGVYRADGLTYVTCLLIG